ncbi:MAG: ATP-binding protein [Christensenellales bacterium]|nr:ATP-binding protein [Christensenellales bacterium]
MKKQSVLIQRTLLFTAIVALSAVAAGLPVFLTVHSQTALRSAREVLSAHVRSLASKTANPEDSGRLEDQAATLAYLGGEIWLSDGRSTRSLTQTAFALPESADGSLSDALQGYETVHQMNVRNRSYAVIFTPVQNGEGEIIAALVAALPAENGNAFVSLIAGMIAGLLAALLVGWALVQHLLKPVVFPISRLRDTAVAVASGRLDTRAREDYPGELGQLAKALNHVSTQLARNMYTLILERNRLRHMLDGLSEGIVAIDNTGAVTHTNPALDRMFTKQKPALHLPDARMKILPDKTVWEDFDEVIRTGTPLSRNLVVRDITLRLTITPIVDEIGAIAGAVGLISDITQMERLERTRREYVSNVSHELRTPLTAMRALVEPLKEGMVTSETDRMRYYDIILREIMRLSRLINDQLELSRLQSGSLAIQKSRIRLDDLIYDVCDRYISIAAEHGLTLNVLTDFSGFPVVYANADRVEQMLIILLDNAIKYTEKGAVNVSGVFDDEKVILSVSDTGVGIDDEDLPYVFDRFYKVDKAHSGKGSGLGLSIASELLKRMNEEIWVTSEKDKGSEFSFTIHRPTPEDTHIPS